MKLLAFFFLVGLAAASKYDALKEVRPLKAALGFPGYLFYGIEAADEIERAARGSSFKEMDELLDRIKEGIETQDKYKNRDGNNEEDDEVTAFFRDLLGKIGKTKKSIQSWEFDASRADFDLKALFQKLKKSILERIDKDKVKAKIEEIFGKGNEMADALLNFINEKGDKWKSKLHDLIDRYLGKDSKDKRSLKEKWEQLKEYLKNFHIELKDKYMKLADWIKKNASKGLDASKSRIENMKQITREALDNMKDMKKDVMAQLIDFIQPYKDDMKALWEQLKDASKDIMSRQD